MKQTITNLQGQVTFLSDLSQRQSENIKFHLGRFENLQTLWFESGLALAFTSRGVADDKTLEMFTKILNPATMRCDSCDETGTCEAPDDLPEDHYILGRCPTCTDKQGTVSTEYREFPKDVYPEPKDGDLILDENEDRVMDGVVTDGN